MSNKNKSNLNIQSKQFSQSLPGNFKMMDQDDEQVDESS